MTSCDPLVARIRGEYREMPGLRLTFPQACRLWHLDAASCALALDTLLTERFLHQTHDGAYVAWPERRATPAKAALPASRPSHTRRRSA